VRFDMGDTIIRYGEHKEFVPFPISAGDPGPQTVPSETTHNFQFTGGVAFRFGGGAEPDGDGSQGGGGERVRRFEVGVQFSSLVLRPPASGFAPFADSAPEGSTQAEAGGGARLGFNVTDDLALEIEGNFYPRRGFTFDTAVGGYPAQVQAGAKYGRRFERFGVFAKARPGVVTFSSVNEVSGYEAFPFGGQTFFLSPSFRATSKTYFSMDLGGVLEFYPSPRVLTRFDVGDTMIRYSTRDSVNGAFNTPPPRLPAELRHNLQITAGIGFRF
jgi:hypothetical protein